jgi:hypothetical protein
MKKLRIRREPVLYTTVLVGVLVLHFTLCYPGAVARGYPPLEMFWIVSIYLAFPGVGVAAFFDDFAYAPGVRYRLLTAFSVTSTLMVGVVWANGIIRPSTGHLTGYMGVIYHHWIHILLNSFSVLVVTLPFVFCWESVCRGVWAFVREFSSPRPTRMGVGGLLRLVIAVGILCGAVKFVVSLDPRYFSRPFLMH